MLRGHTTTAELNFVRQQGFTGAASKACGYQYPALMWQPRAIGGLVLVGLVIQAWPYFLALAALLWWNVVLPRFNPFDALYNHFVAKPKSLPRPGPAPVRARHGGDLHARNRADALLSLVHDRLGYRNSSARCPRGVDLRPLLSGIVPLPPFYRAG